MVNPLVIFANGFQNQKTVEKINYFNRYNLYFAGLWGLHLE
jgi:hypothetical protein